MAHKNSSYSRMRVNDMDLLNLGFALKIAITLCEKGTENDKLIAKELVNLRSKVDIEYYMMTGQSIQGV